MQDPIDVKSGGAPDNEFVRTEGAAPSDYITELDDDLITRDVVTMTRAQWAIADLEPRLEGVPFIHDHTNEDGTEWAPLGVVDVFAVDVEFAQDRAYGPSPTFDTYDEARAVGVDLLKNHADARSFSVRKSTILR